MIAIPNQINSDLEAFLFVKDHLLTQKKRSESNFDSIDEKVNTCKYRGPEGLACAIGALIPNEFYDEAMEGCGSNDDYVIDALEEAFPEWNINVATLVMLEQLQTLHDSIDPERWENVLNVFGPFIDNCFGYELEELD